ncbi:hypothetical protein FQR65_LT20867 [Abscondita terminalis]|nr:hypothetical protein FQR65_LT20867 [Abscondita terminalis]
MPVNCATGDARIRAVVENWPMCDRAGPGAAQRTGVAGEIDRGRTRDSAMSSSGRDGRASAHRRPGAKHGIFDQARCRGSQRATRRAPDACEADRGGGLAMDAGDRVRDEIGRAPRQEALKPPPPTPQPRPAAEADRDPAFARRPRRIDPPSRRRSEAVMSRLIADRRQSVRMLRPDSETRPLSPIVPADSPEVVAMERTSCRCGRGDRDARRLRYSRRPRTRRRSSLLRPMLSSEPPTAEPPPVVPREANCADIDAVRQNRLGIDMDRLSPSSACSR